MSLFEKDLPLTREKSFPLIPPGFSSYQIANLEQHIEEFAAAYYMHTHLPPDQVIMYYKNEVTAQGIVVSVWFEKKPDPS